MFECRSTYPAVSATVVYLRSRENAGDHKLRLLLFTQLQAYAGSEFLPKRGILLTELLKFGLQILFGHGSPAFVMIASAGCSYRCGVAARADQSRKKKRRLAKQTVASLSAQGPDLDCSQLAVMNANNDPLGVRSACPFPVADAEGRPFGFRQFANRLSPFGRSGGRNSLLAYA